ncbi:hypothetical protein GFH30_10185 [Acinetobacter wanghuae]|uniref:Peptidase S11 D-alanyl-D-alanine carboxypeptidase A N-terminal domain-containing protein n=1 Tax=Acinetobacter wanghuae TaxID=2662362 RepID=A0A5Q0P3H4_9GAMM|nr:serine hydrolase [Acinetobacter wanghuae]MQW91368.1 hypothetical protein [Acinetobacter wanghuae]QGA11727.1 hypothetical protein GFH30_10185 [Acinetobacter wanghuae]
MQNIPLIEKMARLSDSLNQSLTGKHILIRMYEKGGNFTLYQKNIDRKVVPASTAKIFLLDRLLNSNIDMDEYLEVTEDDVRKGSGNNLKVGELYRVQDLIKNLMIASSNTSAAVLRKYLEKVQDYNFISYINQYNSTRGMINTHLVNEHGLADRLQYTTLSDLKIILDAKLTDARFQAMSNITEHVFYSKSGDEIRVKNTYESELKNKITAVKTGTLVPGIFNILIFFKLEKCKGYIVDFYNENIELRNKDITNALMIIQKWSDEK